MCGIAGILGGPRVEAETLTRMIRALAHRGPDDEGIWIEPEARIGLAHRRLSIIDLSAAGHQPMASPSGRFAISFNGEIYNHREVRKELEAAGARIAWRGHADTETLLGAIDHWGLVGALERVTGMFALALWDKRHRALMLARDRLGEKPLFYGFSGGSFLFASELKAILQFPGFEARIDRRSLGLFLRYLAVPAPASIYQGIAKLLPGTVLTLEAGGEPVIERYWSGAEVARSGAAHPLALGDTEAVDRLEAVLERAIGRQMTADVPLGAFLSGGIDSSTVVAIMQKLSPRPVKTFTIGFHEPGYNEAERAKAVADHLGTEHNELYVTPAEALAVIPSLPAMFDEPFADSSQIPTYLVSALARREVAVALSGDGGDELFGGYNRYLLTSSLWRRIERIPRPMRRAVAAAVTMVPPGAWTTLGKVAGRRLPPSFRLGRLGDKIHKGAALLESRSCDELYEGTLSAWKQPQRAVVGIGPTVADRPEFGDLGPVERMMAQDMLGYLADDILVKVDRAAMAVSLESRVPFLDPEVVELAWRLPLAHKIRGTSTKWILRQVLGRHVPQELFERPKMGFGVPLDFWLRGPLREWTEELLDRRRLDEEGYFHSGEIRNVWQAELAGESKNHLLWPILMFESWLEWQSRVQASSRATVGGEDRPAPIAASL